MVEALLAMAWGSQRGMGMNDVKFADVDMAALTLDVASGVVGARDEASYRAARRLMGEPDATEHDCTLWALSHLSADTL